MQMRSHTRKCRERERKKKHIKISFVDCKTTKRRVCVSEWQHISNQYTVTANRMNMEYTQEKTTINSVFVRAAQTSLRLPLEALRAVLTKGNVYHTHTETHQKQSRADDLK